MPPAFVLSQDQTLHKLKLVYQINLIKALLIRLTSHNEIFKVYIALFNFQSAVNQLVIDGFLIYHNFLSLSSRVLYFFKFRFDKNRNDAKLNDTLLNGGGSR